MTLALPPSWALPAAIEAYKRRQDVASAFHAVLNRIAGKKRNIVVTGMSGAGKTMLLQALTDATARRGFRPPEGRSTTTERGKVAAQAARRRIALAVVPGQPGYRREAALDELLLAKKPVDGIIHVVCNGFAGFQEAPSSYLSSQGLTSLDAIRTHYLKQELSDFEQTLALLRSAWRKHHKPFWMLIAVAKVDLFQDKLDEAWGRYAKGGNGPFCDQIQEFEMNIGRDNFEWEAQPVCSWLQGFEWQGVRVAPQLDMAQRDHYLATFASHLERHCG